MLSTTDFYNGLYIEMEDDVWVIVEFLHRRSAQGQATVRTKLKNLRTGNVREVTFRAGEKFKEPNLEAKKAEYLYSDNNYYYFMDKTTFEQIQLSENEIHDAKNFLKENTLVEILFHNGKVIGVKLPNFVEMEVIETEKGIRGDTVSNTLKPAKIETGAYVSVPLFINTGDIIKIDTRTGEYVERVK